MVNLKRTRVSGTRRSSKKYIATSSSSFYIKERADFERSFRKSVLILKGNALYRINETGKIIWDFLDKMHPDDIARVISETKNLPFEKVREQVYNFINQLEKHRIIKFRSLKG